MMMKKVTTYVLLSVFLFACSKKTEEYPMFDFGKAKFNEPFVGLLKLKPTLLVKSLEYPPFSWFTSDTVYLEKKYEIAFNEECLRSNSSVTLQLTDSIGKPFDNISIYYNDEFTEDGKFLINANNEGKDISIKLKLNPIIGETQINGFFLAQGYELDSINNVSLQQENNIIALWRCEQKIGWSLLLWLSWFLTLVLIIVIVVFIIYVIVTYVVPFLIKVVGGIVSSVASFLSKLFLSLVHNKPVYIKKILPQIGHWSGKKGNSKYFPDRNYRPIPKHSRNNPDNLTMGEILDKNNVEFIEYRKGEPDFSPISKGTVKIKNFTDIRYGKDHNFDQADGELAKKLNCTKEEVFRYRVDNNLTYHERLDCKTMDLVPKEIHDNISHSGGISVYKAKMKLK